MAQHQKSERGFGKYEIAIGGGGDDEAEVFTYDLDENDGIINFERLEDSKDKERARAQKEGRSGRSRVDAGTDGRDAGGGADNGTGAGTDGRDDGDVGTSAGSSGGSADAHRGAGDEVGRDVDGADGARDGADGIGVGAGASNGAGAGAKGDNA